MGLFYSKVSKLELSGYANDGYLLDPRNGISQIDYLFTYDGTTMSWRSMKQSITTILSNHIELLTLH